MLHIHFAFSFFFGSAILDLSVRLFVFLARLKNLNNFNFLKVCVLISVSRITIYGRMYIDCVGACKGDRKKITHNIVKQACYDKSKSNC